MISGNYDGPQTLDSVDTLDVAAFLPANYSMLCGLLKKGRIDPALFSTTDLSWIVISGPMMNDWRT